MVKALDLRSNGRMSAWVRTPPVVIYSFCVDWTHSTLERFIRSDLCKADFQVLESITMEIKGPMVFYIKGIIVSTRPKLAHYYVMILLPSLCRSVYPRTV